MNGCEVVRDIPFQYYALLDCSITATCTHVGFARGLGCAVRAHHNMYLVDSEVLFNLKCICLVEDARITRKTTFGHHLTSNFTAHLLCA